MSEKNERMLPGSCELAKAYGPILHRVAAMATQSIQMATDVSLRKHLMASSGYFAPAVRRYPGPGSSQLDLSVPEARFRQSQLSPRLHQTQSAHELYRTEPEVLCHEDAKERVAPVDEGGSWINFKQRGDMVTWWHGSMFTFLYAWTAESI